MSVTVDQVRPLLENRLETWKRSADEGLQNFIDRELIHKLYDDFNAKGFLVSLGGNVIWAAACFTTGGAAFAISLAGIAVATAGSYPEHDSSGDALMHIKEGMQRQLDETHRLSLEAVPALVDRIVHNPNEDLWDTPEKVLSVCLGQLFELHYLENDVVTIREGEVRDYYEHIAKTKLDEWIEANKPKPDDDGDLGPD